MIDFLKKPYICYAIVLAAFVACIVFYYPYRYDFSCGDLGLKVEASRLIAEGKDAYFMKDEAGQKMVNGIISTPFVSMLHWPLVGMTSCDRKDAAFWMEYALLAALLCFVFWLTKDPLKRYIQCAAVVLFFIVSRYWFITIKLGQTYPFYTLLLFALYFLRAKKLDFLFGLMLVISIACRPLFLMPAGLLLIFFFNKKFLKGGLTGFALMAVITLATHSFSYWPEYFKAMGQYVPQLTSDVPYLHMSFHSGHAVPNDAWSDCNKGMGIPEDSIIHMAPGRPAGLLQPLETYIIKATHHVILNANFYSFTALGLSLIVVLLVRLKFKELTPEQYAMLFFVIYIITEICTPAPRGPYNYVFWLFGTALIIAKGRYLEILLLLLGLALNHDHPHINYGREYGEVFMLAACFIYLFRGQKTGDVVRRTNPFVTG